MSASHLEKSHDSVRKYIDSLFSAARLKSDCRLLVKPNIVSREPYPTTTDPCVVEWVLDSLRAHLPEANISVADGSAPDKVYVVEGEEGPSARMNAERYHREFRERFLGMTDFPEPLKTEIEARARRTVENSGIASVCRERGVRISSFYEFRFKHVRSQGADIRIADTDSYDAMINLPVLKLHSHCGYTGALKNLYGLLYHFDKNLVHSYTKTRGFNFLQLIRELPSLVGDVITITDASHVQDAQEAVWGAGKVFKLPYGLLAGDSREVDEEEERLLREHGLIRPHFYEYQRFIKMHEGA